MSKRNIPYILIPLLAIASMTTTIVTSGSVFAACAGVETNIINCPQGEDDAEGAAFSLLSLVIMIMTGGIGIVAIGAIVAGAILYSMSGTQPGNIQKAKTIWTNTVIGLVVYAFLISVTNFIVPGGVF